jgi:hypothetical protein
VNLSYQYDDNIIRSYTFFLLCLTTRYLNDDRLFIKYIFFRNERTPLKITLYVLLRGFFFARKEQFHDLVIRMNKS